MKRYRTIIKSYNGADFFNIKDFKTDDLLIIECIELPISKNNQIGSCECENVNDIFMLDINEIINIKNSLEFELKLKRKQYKQLQSISNETLLYMISKTISIIEKSLRVINDFLIVECPEEII